MHLADAFIQSDLHCIQVTVFTFYLAFPGNRTHDLGVASAMLYHLSYRKAVEFWMKQKVDIIIIYCNYSPDIAAVEFEKVSTMFKCPITT